MIVVPAVLFLVLLVGGLWLFDAVISMPSLSTKFAEGFSERSFKRIKVGMTAQEMKALVGEPLRMQGKDKDVKTLWYSEPKEPAEDWGTWEARYLVIMNNLVTEVFAHKVINH